MIDGLKTRRLKKPFTLNLKCWKRIIFWFTTTNIFSLLCTISGTGLRWWNLHWIVLKAVQLWSIRQKLIKESFSFSINLVKTKCKENLKKPWNVIHFLLLGKVSIAQCDQKKSPNVYKSCPEMISLEKWWILTHLPKLPKNEIWEIWAN